MKHETIYERGPYRILEMIDDISLVSDLLGEMFSPTVNPDLSDAELKKQEGAFIDEIEYHGVYGYELQKWNPEIGKGWEHVDSCFGFVGKYHPVQDKFNHPIVDELIEQSMENK